MPVVANEIRIGNYNYPSFSFQNDEIISITGENEVSLSGGEMTIDTITPDVLCKPYGHMLFRSSDSKVLRDVSHVLFCGDRLSEGNVLKVFKPYDYDSFETSDGRTYCVPMWGDIRNVKYGTPLWFFHDQELIGKYYCESITQLTKSQYEIQAFSIVGLLDKQYHVGGVYNAVTFSTVLGQIIGSSFSYTCDTTLASKLVYGYLPYDTKRNNLHKLLFAYSALLTKDANGNIIFTRQYSSTPKEVELASTFNSGTVEYRVPVTSITVTQYGYATDSTASDVTLFDNTNGTIADHTLKIFDTAPIDTTSVTTTGTLSVNEIGVNYAIVSGTGTLLGKPYKVTSQDKATANPVEASEGKTVAVKNNTLISGVNVDFVTQRVLAYYNAVKDVKINIVLNNERAGNHISFRDMFGSNEDGYISSLSYKVSSFIKAQCKVLTDYTPGGQGSGYTRAIILTGSGTWTVPSDILEQQNPIIGVVLIGGGQGGYNGTCGTSGQSGGNMKRSSPSDALYCISIWGGIGGAYGRGGSPGIGGNILSTTISVSASLSSFQYSCGAGGAGAAQNATRTSSAGAMGGNTTFGTYTSANGTHQADGIINIFNGDVYGSDGVDNAVSGTRGQNGNTSEVKGKYTTEFNGNTYYSGENGSMTDALLTEQRLYCCAGGGGGGGNTVSANTYGATGNNADGTHTTYLVGGSGVDGITPAKRSESVAYGQGGFGGHGGSGGGGGGAAAWVSDDSETYGYGGTGGNPGYGGEGGNGGDGCIIIYC